MPKTGEGSGHSQPFSFLDRLEILPEWEEAARRWLARGGGVMVLGAPDTGKSTLSRYLIYRAMAAGGRVAFVDLDLGQSHLGPPASLGLGLFPPHRPGDDPLSPEGLYFIGQTSPVAAVLEVAVGCRVLADQARRQGVGRVVVNTSGFVQGPGALRLKKAEVELLSPTFILALERRRELELMLKGLGGEIADVAKITPTPTHLPRGRGSNRGLLATGKAECDGETPPLQPVSGMDTAFRAPAPPSRNPAAGTGSAESPVWQIIRLPVSSRLSRRRPEERRFYREERFHRYFQGARAVNLRLAPLSFQGLPFGAGRPLTPTELGQWGQRLGTPALRGESAGRRLFLLLADSPPRHGALESGAGVRWLAWPSLAWQLVGLLDGAQRTLALGLIRPGPWDRKHLTVITPWPASEAGRVRFVKLGKIKVSREGLELGDV
jgi:polynucleotide 5'-kinase involved in rRNA processing